jgi:L-ascorbate metabolism protein UlaG (beta-lactamase superfamily)
VTHNHYDHLNRQTVQQLHSRVKQFIVPIGVSPLLVKWGVAAEKIVELDWWQSHKHGEVTITSTPAKHFSGRGLTDRNKTGWCSYVVNTPDRNIYCGGDSGYGTHFTEIGKRFGPFDLTILECGQYNDSWADIHMRPEETVQAHLDLGGKQLLPVHWAGFTLSLHDWDEPIRRVVAAAKIQRVSLATPHIGEAMPIGDAQHSFTTWWENHKPKS